MIEFNGAVNSAKAFTDKVEENAASQIVRLLNQDFVKDETIRFMPDVHAGAGCVIGTTMTISDKVCPNLVGVDIGCGMEVVRICEDEVYAQKLDKIIRRNIPSGFSIRDNPIAAASLAGLNELRCCDYVDISRAERSIGTLGGGNHFIEVDKDNDGNVYIVIHSGSRHLGVEVANHYQKLAYEKLNNKADIIKEKITELKVAGKEKMIQQVIEKINRDWVDVPKDLAYVEGQDFEDYIHDMNIVQHFAAINRKAMMMIILKEMRWHRAETFTTVHNYIDTESMILRKGSVSAFKGEKLIIPINMRDGSLICIGKGNPDWNLSAPHGAGRIMSRGEAKSKISMEEYRKAMNGIYSSCVTESTLDEAPFVYKPIEDIVNNIGDTVDIIEHVIPIYNFKAN